MRSPFFNPFTAFFNEQGAERAGIVQADMRPVTAVPVPCNDARAQFRFSIYFLIEEKI